jgi:hypothetical protein
MQYLFFNFYNRLYQDGKSNIGNHPEWDAYGMMVTGAIMWYLLFYEIYYYEILNMNFPENFKVIGFIICLLFLTTFYFMYLYKGIYRKIYLKYNYLNIKQRKFGLVISMFYLFLPVSIAAFITLKWHGKI